MNNFSLHLIDTTEPSNIIAPKIGELVFWDKDIEPKGLVNNGWSYKLLVLCSDEAIDKSKDKYLDLTHGIIMNGVFVGSSDGNVKKVIATNSKKTTPNCYISEDRVKEFVEYWNKYKELPKFSIQRMVAFEPKNNEDSKVNLAVINNQLQIKWLSNEESKETNLEQELEDVADEYRFLNGKADVEASVKTQKTCYTFDEVNKLMIEFAKSNIAKKIHQQEAVELIKGMIDLVKLYQILLPKAKTERTQDIITKAENFLKSKQ